ncbi:MAG: hypothetical protein N2511_08545 [Thermodesulfovibrionales bacterium]|nr:hypothetical protein [Thermodesulfovibrionales bacterium]
MLKAEIQKIRAKTGFSLHWVLKHIGIGRATYYRWLNYKEKGDKGFVHPLRPLNWEVEAVVAYAKRYPLTGYKKLTYQMLDEGIVALSLFHRFIGY